MLDADGVTDRRLGGLCLARARRDSCRAGGRQNIPGG